MEDAHADRVDTAYGLALRVVQRLWLAGVRDVVLAPGSRSAPLALVLHAADTAGDLRLHVRVDERSAGFLALGLTTGARRPVAVVTTSGTAVGNLLPAVMEAHHTGRRLVVVSADRPARLRGTGANQTTEQAGIYGVFATGHDLTAAVSARALADVVQGACTRAGATHLNLQLDGDLLPPDPDPDHVVAPTRRRCARRRPRRSRRGWHLAVGGRRQRRRSRHGWNLAVGRDLSVCRQRPGAAPPRAADGRRRR